MKYTFSSVYHLYKVYFKCTEFLQGHGNPSFPKYFKCFLWIEERAIQKVTNVDRVLDINKVICDINKLLYLQHTKLLPVANHLVCLM